MQAGGRLVFHGPPDLLVRHFEHVTRRVREGDPCEWVLAVVEGSSVDGRSRSSAELSDPAAFFARAYEKSDPHTGQLALVDELSRRTPALDAGLEEYGLCRKCGTDADRGGSATALTFSESLWVLAEREALLKRRDLGLVKAQILRVTIIGLVGGVLFFQLPRDTEGAFNAVGALYFALNFLSFGAMPQMAGVLQCKHIMIRQRNDRWFSGSAYGLVAAAMMVPFTFLEVAIFSPVFYFMAGLSPIGFVPFLVLCFLANMAMGGLFRLLGASCPNLVVASSFGSLVLLLFIVTSGFTIVRSDLPPYLLPVYYLTFSIIFWNAFCGFAIPVTSMPPWVAWIYWICPTWSLYSLAASQLGDSEVPITLAGGAATVPARVYLEDRYGDRYDFRWNAVAALFGFNLLLALLFLLTLRFVNWQTR